MSAVAADGPFFKFERLVWRRILQLTTGVYDREKGHYVDGAPPLKPPRTGRTLEYGWRLRSIQVCVRDPCLETIREQDEELENVREVFKYLETRYHGRGNLRKIFLMYGLSDEAKLRIRRTAWNYPGVFLVTANNRKREDWVQCTEEAKQIMEEEQKCWDEGNEEESVKMIKRILMMTQDRRFPVSRLKWIKKYYGFPPDFDTGFLGRHPQHFRVVEATKGTYVELVSWDYDLAVTVREKAVEQGRTSRADGPYAFEISYPPGYSPNRVRREELDRFQQVEFPSPYTFASKELRNFRSESGQKRALAVYHELLTFTLEKRALVSDFAYLGKELHLPRRYPSALLDCHPGIFYVSHWKNDFYVFLRDAYQGGELKQKSPVVGFRERYLELMKVQPEVVHQDWKHRFVPKKLRGEWSNRDHLQREDWAEKEQERDAATKEERDTFCTPILQ